MARKHGTVQNGRPRERGLITQTAQRACKRDPKWTIGAQNPRLAEVLRQIRIFPHTARRASGPDARQSVAGMEACAAVALWTSVSLPDIAWRASAVWSGENGRRGWNLHSRFFQRIYPFPDTATKPARLRPSDKYMPCRMWHDAQARSGVGKTVTGDGPVRPILPANPSLFGYRHTARLIAAFRQVHAFPDVAWRTSAVWSEENGRRRWACAADSSSESIPFRISPYSPPNRGLPTSTCLPGCGMAHKRGLE